MRCARSARSLWVLGLVLASGPVFAQKAPPPQLVVTSAVPDADGLTMLITGVNFGSTPLVTLELTNLQLDSASDTQIVAALPQGWAPGTYLLTVSRGPSKTDSWTSVVTLGAIGPKGEKGDPGAKGDVGAKGDPGDQGIQGIQGIQGVPGGLGPQGPVGLSWKGPWDQQAAYVATDVVQQGGASYVALGPNTGSEPPSADWSLLASKGDAGPQGETGATGIGVQGVPGIQGPPGPPGPAGIVPGATELGAAIYKITANSCGMTPGLLTTDASCSYTPSPVCLQAYNVQPPANCPPGDNASLIGQPTHETVCVSSYTASYVCGTQSCNPYQCNPFQCNPYACNPHSCNCGPFGCDTCYSTCYNTCYNTCYQQCPYYCYYEACNQYADRVTACYSCATSFTPLGKLVK